MDLATKLQSEQHQRSAQGRLARLPFDRKQRSLAGTYSTRLRQGICVMFGAFAISACASIDLGAENETDIRIIDLKTSAAGPFGWVDNETFVIMANTGERYTRKDGEEVRVARVMTHNYRTGERKVFGRVSSGLCYASDGYVSYIFADDATGELWASYGELGKETTRKIKPGEMNFDRGPEGSCRPWTERPANPPWVKEKTAIWHLWPRLGLINCQAPTASVRTQYIKARFHKPGDEAGVELPFSCYEVFGGLRYYAFKSAYLALEFDFRSPWPQGRDRRAFWLYPDGRVETVSFPYSQTIRARAIPTARGFVAFARPGDREDDHGIYLITPESTRRIARGNAAGVTSPDGCKVAMLHDPDFKARARTRGVAAPVTLKVLDLCEAK